MECRKCKCKWILGNVNPSYKMCPVCEEDYLEHKESVLYTDPYELIYILLLDKTNELMDDPGIINAYLNDYFPTEYAFRGKIAEELSDSRIKMVCGWMLEHKNVNDVLLSFHGISNDTKKFLMFVFGNPPQKGTQFDDSFYLHFSESCEDKYKLMSLYKAYQFKASESTMISIVNEKRRKKDNSWKKDIDELDESVDENTLIDLFKIFVDENENERAIQYLKKASDQDGFRAKRILGKELIKGERINKNVTQGFELIKVAADKGDSQAAYLMYNLYLDKKDYDNSRKYLGISVGRGYMPACFEYAMHLLEGDLVTENVDKSVKLLEQCAANQYEDSIRQLIYIYSVGYKVIKDTKTAMMWKEKLDGIT